MSPQGSWTQSSTSGRKPRDFSWTLTSCCRPQVSLWIPCLTPAIVLRSSSPWQSENLSLPPKPRSWHRWLSTSTAIQMHCWRLCQKNHETWQETCWRRSLQLGDALRMGTLSVTMTGGWSYHKSGHWRQRGAFAKIKLRLLRILRITSIENATLRWMSGVKHVSYVGKRAPRTASISSSSLAWSQSPKREGGSFHCAATKRVEKSPTHLQM
mmetsp:Transcript_35125/g.64231  ORF Transcript_35125/g.64231 Transcript_35125/m.64231 type:complete len:211 (+) Transcript_35125:1827-2459(+)